MQIVIFILNIILLIASIIMSIYFFNCFFTKAPFVPVKRRTLEQIIKSLKLVPNCVLYDLGCGDARVLLEAIKYETNIKAIGVERNIIVFLWAKLLTKDTAIKIHCKDINDISLADTTHIYLYLHPEIMDELLKKFKKECAPGTRIVSCSFVFSNMIPDEIINLPIKKDNMCKKLYIYILK
jgi:hypothetical protein